MIFFVSDLGWKINIGFGIIASILLNKEEKKIFMGGGGGGCGCGCGNNGGGSGCGNNGGGGDQF